MRRRGGSEVQFIFPIADHSNCTDAFQTREPQFAPKPSYFTLKGMVDCVAACRP